MKKALIVTTLLLSVLFLRSITLDNKLYLSGEFLFSYDYLGHAYNILNNKILNRDSVLFVSQCPGCPAFYHISSWYMYWVMSLLAVGQLLGIHPFVYYQFVNFTAQLFALYVFTKLIIKKINAPALFISAVFLIYFPHKIYIMPSATLDGVIHAILIATLTFWLYFLQNISKFSKKYILKLSIIFGFFLNLYLNIAIAHFPLVLLSLPVIAMYYIQKLITKPLKTFYFGLFAVIVVCLLNIPLLVSQILKGNLHHITSFNTLNLVDSLTAGSVTAGVSQSNIYLLFGTILAFLLFSSIKSKHKLTLIIIYILVALFLTGFKFNTTYYYQYIFDYVPFMNHMRGLYRYIFFLTLLLYTFVYTGLLRLLTSKIPSFKIFGLILGLLLLLPIKDYINFRHNLFHTAQLPDTYFKAAEFLDDLPGNKIYFPPYWSTYGPSMSGNYSWIPDKKVISPTIYTNPFTSLFSVSGISNVESQYPTIEQQQLRSLIDLSLPPTEIIASLQHLGIEHLILDSNYDWSSNFPDFNLDNLATELELEKSYENLSVYKVPNKSSGCIPSYGNFISGYCINLVKPVVFIDKTYNDYVLDKLSNESTLYSIPLSKNSNAPNFIVNVDVRNEVQKNGILVPFSINQFDGFKKNVYSKRLSAGTYHLFIPYLSLSSADRLFKDETLTVEVNGQKIKTIVPYSHTKSFIWDQTVLKGSATDQLVSLSTSGHGSIVLGKPLLLRDSDIQNIMSYKKAPVSIICTHKYSQEHDILIDPNVEYKNFKPYDQIDYAPTFMATSSDSTVTVSIPFNKPSTKVQIVTSTAYLDKPEDGLVYIYDYKNKEILKFSISRPGTPVLFSDLDLPSNINSGIKIKLVFKKPGALISRFVVRITSSDPKL